QTWTVVLHSDASPVRLSDGRDKAEAEAIARAVSAPLDPVEPLEDVRALFEGNARSMISDRNRGTVTAVPPRDLDIAGPAMLDRIVDEVGNRVEQEIPVAKHGHPAVALELHATALLFGRGVEQLCDLAGDFIQVDDAERRVRIERLDTRDAQQRRKGPQHGIELSHRIDDERVSALGVERLTIGLFQSAPQPREGRP